MASKDLLNKIKRTYEQLKVGKKPETEEEYTVEESEKARANWDKANGKIDESMSNPGQAFDSRARAAAERNRGLEEDGLENMGVDKYKYARMKGKVRK